MLKQTLAALTLAIGPFTAVTPALAEAPDFNGTWSVQLVTEAGVCGDSSSYTVVIQDGQVRLASGGGSMTGRIGSDGSVGLSVRQEPASGSASGRLRSSAGSGTWKAASICSGRWAAQRRSTVTAQAR